MAAIQWRVALLAGLLCGGSALVAQDTPARNPVAVPQRPVAAPPLGSKVDLSRLPERRGATQRGDSLRTDATQQPQDAPSQTGPPAIEPPSTSPQTGPQQLQDIINDSLETSSDLNNFTPSNLLATRGSFGRTPTMMGDLFGVTGGFTGQLRVPFQFVLPGTILSGTSGDPNAIIGFDITPLGPVDDIVTTGVGFDVSGDGNPDTFFISEPLPTSDAPTSPGPGFIFDSATATAAFINVGTGPPAVDGIFTNGENWFVSYAYVANIGPGGLVPVPGPGVATRRVKVAENYSAEVRNRFIYNFNFFNDVTGGLGDIGRYTIGTERVFLEDLASVEVRLPFAATYGAIQAIDGARDRDFELGNITVLLKAILYASDNFLVTGGVGVAAPTADDTRLQFGGQDILMVRNETVHLLPFLGCFHRVNNDLSVQSVLQVDAAVSGDPVFGDLINRPNVLPQIGTFNDSTLLAASLSANRSVYQDENRSRNSLLQELLLNAELHYTGTLQDSDFVSASGITYTNLSRNFNVLNATLGMHFILNNDWVISPGMSIPLRNGTDEQFDYEVILQANYLK